MNWLCLYLYFLGLLLSNDVKALSYLHTVRGVMYFCIQEMEVDSEISLSKEIINQKETGIGTYYRRNHLKGWFRIYMTLGCD